MNNTLVRITAIVAILIGGMLLPTPLQDVFKYVLVPFVLYVLYFVLSAALICVPAQKQIYKWSVKNSVGEFTHILVVTAVITLVNGLSNLILMPIYAYILNSLTTVNLETGSWQHMLATIINFIASVVAWITMSVFSSTSVDE